MFQPPGSAYAEPGGFYPAPGSDVISRNDAAGEQIISYAEAARRLQAEEKATAAGVDAIHTDASEYTRYEELKRKFINGNINEGNSDERWRLDNISGQSDWASKYVGRDLQMGNNMPAVANSANDGYNENTWNLYRGYTTAIDSGELSPLADFALYQQIGDEMDRLLVGAVTSNGIAITGKSSHSVARVIESVEQRRSGVSVADVLHALIDKDSEVLPVKGLKNSRSQKFRSDKVEVSVNPDTGIIIQVNPVHSKRKVKQ